MKLWGEVMPHRIDTVDFEPEMHVYEGDSKGAVVIFPGGGYEIRAEHEGHGYARWLQSIGITAWVVDYRVAPYAHPAIICDGLRAVKVARANAEKYGYDKDKIAVMGSSAGGHLAASVSVHYDKEFYQATDEIDKESAKPNASILCYSVLDMHDFRHDGTKQKLLGRRCTEADRDLMSLPMQVNINTPQTFLWHTAADPAVPVENTLLYAAALSKWMVPFEAHIFPYGPHGLGLADGVGYGENIPHVAQWVNALHNWLKLIDWE